MKGISGETAGAAARRMEAVLTRYRPAIVIIELGANDGLRGMPITQIKKNLETMINQAKKAHAAVLLVGLQLPPITVNGTARAFYQMFSELAKTHDVALVPFLFENIMEKTGMFQSDNMHPTEKAQPILMNTIYTALKPFWKNSRQKSNPATITHAYLL